MNPVNLISPKISTYWYWSHPVKAARRRTRRNLRKATKLVGLNIGLRDAHQLKSNVSDAFQGGILTKLKYFWEMPTH